jgi:hypothetical protein
MEEVLLMVVVLLVEKTQVKLIEVGLMRQDMLLKI